MFTLATFSAMRTFSADLGSTIGQPEYFEGTQAGYTYGNTGLYIEQLPDGKYHLLIERDEWTSNNLQELEAILYAWALSEYGEEYGTDSDVLAFVNELQIQMGMENFARAILANLQEPDAHICHMHDHADANQCALDVAHDDVDKATDVYIRARPILRGA